MAQIMYTHVSKGKNKKIKIKKKRQNLKFHKEPKNQNKTSTVDQILTNIPCS
jgi:hypothetical protein